GSEASRCPSSTGVSPASVTTVDAGSFFRVRQEVRTRPSFQQGFFMCRTYRRLPYLRARFRVLFAFRSCFPDRPGAGAVMNGDMFRTYIPLANGGRFGTGKGTRDRFGPRQFRFSPDPCLLPPASFRRRIPGGARADW